MGFNVHHFLGPVDENLLCSICSNVLEDAVLTPCGHSFCLLCLETWLARPSCSSCPQCRGRVLACQARPIIAVRNLINSLEVFCDNHDRGCRLALRLESMPIHLMECGFGPVECAGCSQVINRADLAEHHINCEAIAAAIREDELEDADSDSQEDGPSSGGCSNGNTSPLHLEQHVTEVADLACRVATLELQLKRLKRDLAAADVKNKRLDRELKRTRDELENKRVQLIDSQYVNFDHDYDYGFTSQSIAKLSAFIARFLLRKPSYVDRNRIFNAINRCYDNYGRSRDYANDVHMLLATAYASNWFNENQKLNFHCLLQALQRHRQHALSSLI